MNIILRGLDYRLDEILQSTYYQLIYQEQVTEIATKIAGWDTGRADTIRKTIGRKIQSELDELIPQLIQSFIEYGGMEKGNATALATAISACGSYLFNKAHSVEYGLISWQTAYLKANYPVEYMCSLLNANMDKTEETVPYIQECKKMGIKILPPSVAVGNLRFEPEHNGIRIGLTYIKGISHIEINYKENIYAFFNANNFNKRVKEALIKSGALDCFGKSRSELMKIAFNIKAEIQERYDKIDVATNKIYSKQEEIANSKQGTKKVATLYGQIERLKDSIVDLKQQVSELKQLFDENNYDDVAGEIDTLGFTFKDKFADYDTDGLQVYNEEKTLRQVFLADVQDVREIKDKNNRKMAFIKARPHSLEVAVEFVMFASRYRPIEANKIYKFVVERKNQIQEVIQAKKKTTLA